MSVELDTGSPDSLGSNDVSDLSLQDDEEGSKERVRICQYAHRVLDFSSQYGSDTSISYTAFNIIGRQSKYPDYGDFPETFAMRTYGRWWEYSPGAPHEIMRQNMPEVPVQDFIVVEFEEYVIPHAVTVYETYNPGSVINIWAYVKHTEEWILLWEGPPSRTERHSRRFSPPIKEIAYPTKIIRLEFNHSCAEYFTEIDAVLLKGTACFNRNSNRRLNTLKLNSARRGYILKRLENFEVKVSESEQHGQQMLQNFLENDLQEFIRETQATNEHQFSLPDIPGEILLKIFSYLDLKSLFKVTRTCRKLYEVGTDPTLYREINLRPYWNLINDAVLNTLSYRATQLRKLDLSWCGLFNAISPLTFKELIRRCGATLQDLRLNSCQFINHTCMEVVGQVCQNLRGLSLRNYSGNVLNFHCIKNWRSLERLDLFRCNINSDLLLMTLKYNPNLKHLNLGIAPPHLSMDEIAVQISKCNPKIVSIDMWKSHFLSSLGLKALANCEHLEEVDFGWCLRTEAFPGDGIKTLLQGCRKMRKLFLAAIRGLSDRDLLVISECTELEQLDLMGVLGISQEGYFHILKHCAKLQLLDLSFCPNDEIQIALWRDAFGVDIKGNFNVANPSLTEGRVYDVPRVALEKTTDYYNVMDDILEYLIRCIFVSV